jgi:predicted GIY-YIG superfamily endonuclease
MAERKKIVGIYKITNILNDKVYIGASNDIFSRFSQHIANIKKGVFNAIPLTEINSIHDLNFELIEETTPDLLTEREAFYIDLYLENRRKQ